MNPGHSEEKFKELLDAEYSWPAPYTFKFVVSSGQLQAVQTLFSDEAKITIKESSGGKYTSGTISVEMANAEDIIAIYKKASEIDGIISL